MEPLLVICDGNIQNVLVPAIGDSLCFGLAICRPADSNWG